jgi:hypothetical protein
MMRYLHQRVDLLQQALDVSELFLIGALLPHGVFSGSVMGGHSLDQGLRLIRRGSVEFVEIHLGGSTFLKMIKWSSV